MVVVINRVQKRSISKKGIFSADLLWYIIRFLFLIAMSLVIILVIRFFVFTTVDVDDVQSKILFYRLVYSRSGISYYDSDISRVYPGVIDPDRMSESALDTSLLMTPNYVAAARIVLKELNGNVIKEVYFNKEWYDRWKPVAEMNLPGQGGVESFEYEIYVLIKSGDDALYRHGMLSVNIVIPR